MDFRILSLWFLYFGFGSLYGYVGWG